ncbi:MAG: hypothetical protein H7330_15435 [Hymenobacteraceae bacterium]|nr:hypothetical protein [Hymenobacteraceae bacterium]
MRLVEEAGGWRVAPSNPDPTPDTDAGFFVRELDLSTATGAAGVRLTYRPARHEYRVGSQVGRGRHVSRATTSFRYPVYRLTQGDADNDGQMDVLVGPVKTTHFDATIQRRLFIYHLDSTGRLRPRWLGSRVIYPLVYFRAGRGTDGRTFIQTIEHPAGQGYCVGRYYWQGFGLSLDHFLARQLSLDAAYSRFLL